MRLSAESLSRSVWFLDYDGSLCPHQEVWEERQYDAAEIYNAVSHLKSRVSNVFWNTGRRRDSLMGVNSQFLELSGYFVQGSFYWDAATKNYVRLGPLLPVEIKQHFEKLLERDLLFRLEVKETSLRVVPKKILHMDRLKVWAATHFLPEFGRDWAWVPGHRGVELLASGFDKGHAIAKERKGHPRMLPVVIGDDILDAPAAELALDMGGHVFLVGDSCGWITKLKHEAWQVHYFDKPSDVLKFLSDI